MPQDRYSGCNLRFMAKEACEIRASDARASPDELGGGSARCSGGGQISCLCAFGAVCRRFRQGHEEENAVGCTNEDELHGVGETE